jgi:hypothetical protein
MEALKQAILQQFEYYFSIENLLRDMYLRGLMDEHHFVPLDIMWQFNRVQRLTSDLDLIYESIKDSPVLEIQEGSVRRRDHPEKFPYVEPVFNAYTPSFFNPYPVHQVQYDISVPEFVPSGLSAVAPAPQETSPVVAVTSSAVPPAPVASEPTAASAASMTVSTTSKVQTRDTESEWVTKTPPKPKPSSAPAPKSKPPQVSVRVNLTLGRFHWIVYY